MSIIVNTFQIVNYFYCLKNLYSYLIYSSFCNIIISTILLIKFHTNSDNKTNISATLFLTLQLCAIFLPIIKSSKNLHKIRKIIFLIVFLLLISYIICKDIDGTSLGPHVDPLSYYFDTMAFLPLLICAFIIKKKLNCTKISPIIAQFFTILKNIYYLLATMGWFAFTNLKGFYQRKIYNNTISFSMAEAKYQKNLTTCCEETTMSYKISFISRDFDIIINLILCLTLFGVFICHIPFIAIWIYWKEKMNYKKEELPVNTDSKILSSQFLGDPNDDDCDVDLEEKNMLINGVNLPDFSTQYQYLPPTYAYPLALVHPLRTENTNNNVDQKISTCHRSTSASLESIRIQKRRNAYNRNVLRGYKHNYYRNSTRSLMLTPSYDHRSSQHYKSDQFIDKDNTNNIFQIPIRHSFNVVPITTTHTRAQHIFDQRRMIRQYYKNLRKKKSKKHGDNN